MRLLYEQLTDIPIGFTEVEYLETINQQNNKTSATDVSWIDTGIIPNDNTKLECRMAFTTLISGNSNEALCGSSGSTGNFRFAWGFASLSPYTNFYAGLGGQNLTTNVTRDTNVHTFKIDAVNKTWAIDSVTGSFTSSGSLSGTSSIFLFGRHIPFYGDNVANKPSNAKIYYCKIWNNTTLVRDFVPCLDTNNTPCLWDKVEGKAYYNQGTGTFNVGRKIIPVEYLESSGTQYIDTGYVLSSDCRGEALAEYTGVPSSGSSYIFGTFGGKKNFGVNTSLHAPDIDTLFYFVWANVSRVDVTGDPLPALNTKYHVTVSRTLMKVNNSSITYDGATFTGSNSAYLFWANGTSQPKSIMKLYWTKFWDGSGNLVRDFIPAVDENNTPYMFDKITHSCFLNAGSGSFLVGNELPKKKLRLLKDNKLRVPNGFTEVEYLESDGNQYIDTEYKPIPATTKFEFMFSPDTVTGNSFLFGCRPDTSIGAFTCTTYFATGNIRQDWAGLNTYFPAITANNKYLYSAYNNTISLNTDSVTSTTTRSTTRLDYNFLLFTVNTNGTADNRRFIGKVYYSKLWDNGNLVRNFIPALNPAGRPCLYDLVGKKAYYNIGTGEFTYGRQIHPVEYLESTGGQYIDTGIQPTDEYGYRIRNTYAVGAGEQCAIGCMDAGNRFVGIYTGGSQVSGGWGSFVGYLKSPYSFTDDTIWNVSCNYKNDRKIILNNEELKDLTDVHITNTISNTIYIGARHYGSNVTKMQGKIYSVEITKGQEVIANYIPAIDENLVPFMFDKVTHTAYANAGTGSFIVGDKIKNVTRFLEGA